MAKRIVSQRPGSSDLSHGFPPVAATDASVLILGSLPSEASIGAGQYYAHPRNVFWNIMEELCGARRADRYADRLEALKSAGIALWDVLCAAGRPGSLDSSIDMTSAEINDFRALYDRCAWIEAVFFNGRKSYELYERRVLPGLSPKAAALPRVLLPSTSPAHASLRYAEKLERWRQAVGPRLHETRSETYS